MLAGSAQASAGAGTGVQAAAETLADRATQLRGVISGRR